MQVLQPAVKGEMAENGKTADSRIPGVDSITKETNEKAAPSLFRES